MKLVLLKYMNPLNFFVGILLLVAACGVKHPIAPNSQLINTNNVAEMGLPIIVPKQPVQPTVIHDTIIDRRVLLKPVQPMIDAQTPPYDTLLKYNFKWQQSYLRLVDSNIVRRVQRDVAVKGKDSALIVAKETRGIVKRLQEQHGTTQAAGEGVINLSDTVAGYMIPYIAIIVTAHLLLPLFRRKKQIA